MFHRNGGLDRKVSDRDRCRPFVHLYSFLEMGCFGSEQALTIYIGDMAAQGEQTPAGWAANAMKRTRRPDMRQDAALCCCSSSL